MPWGAAIFVAAPMAGSRINRAGERPFLVGGLLLGAVGMGWLALIAKPNLLYWQMVPPLVISGLGMSMTIPAAQSAVMTTSRHNTSARRQAPSRRFASSAAHSG
jgi:MFS family permease